MAQEELSPAIARCRIEQLHCRDLLASGTEEYPGGARQGLNDWLAEELEIGEDERQKARAPGAPRQLGSAGCILACFLSAVLVVVLAAAWIEFGIGLKGSR